MMYLTFLNVIHILTGCTHQYKKTVNLINWEIMPLFDYIFQFTPIHKHYTLKNVKL
jgi:hypothetical protein